MEDITIATIFFKLVWNMITLLNSLATKFIWGFNRVYNGYGY